MFQFHPGLPDIIMEVEDGFPQDKVSFRIRSCCTSIIMGGRVSHDQEMTIFIGFCTLYMAVSKMIRFKAGIEIN